MRSPAGLLVDPCFGRSKTNAPSGNRVTEMSRIRGAGRTQEDTRRHDGRRNRVQEGTGGYGRTREDTTYAGFGTVRPRVQIPGPRPVLELGFRRSKLNCARIGGPHGFQPCAIDLKSGTRRLRRVLPAPTDRHSAKTDELSLAERSDPLYQQLIEVRRTSVSNVEGGHHESHVNRHRSDR
jgi:hypothetical protein